MLNYHLYQQTCLQSILKVRMMVWRKRDYSNMVDSDLKIWFWHYTWILNLISDVETGIIMWWCSPVSPKIWLFKYHITSYFLVLCGYHVSRKRQRSTPPPFHGGCWLYHRWLKKVFLSRGTGFRKPYVVPDRHYNISDK